MKKCDESCKAFDQSNSENYATCQLRFKIEKLKSTKA